MNEREKLMMAFSAQQFSKWELHLYLDTHPNDKNALRLFERHEARAREIKEQYESKFGPLTTDSGSGYEWVKEPWPWERGAN